MRKRCKTYEEVKTEIASLLGQEVKISINRGRNRSEKYDGTILFAYPNVFIFKVKGNELVKSLSISYNDLICGDARIKKA